MKPGCNTTGQLRILIDDPSYFMSMGRIWNRISVAPGLATLSRVRFEIWIKIVGRSQSVRRRA